MKLFATMLCLSLGLPDAPQGQQDPYTADQCTSQCAPVISVTPLTLGCASVVVTLHGAAAGQAGEACTPKCATCNARMRATIYPANCGAPVDWSYSCSNYEFDCSPAVGALGNGTAAGTTPLPMAGLKTCCGGMAYYSVMADGTHLQAVLECRCPEAGG